MRWTYSLHKLPHPALAHNRIVTPVHLADLPNLVLGDGAAVHCDVTGKRDGVVVSERELLSSLVLQVEDELGILAVLVGEDVFALEDGGVEAGAAVGGEAILDDTFDVVATEHLGGAKVPGTLYMFAFVSPRARIALGA